MKILITTLLLTASTFANTCMLNLDDKGLGDTYFHDEGEASFFTELDSGKVVLTKEDFESNITFKDFDYDSCFDALVYKTFLNPHTNEEFKAIYSNEDHCDGGNSYGYITSAKDTKIIATIQDSDFYCL